MLDKRRVRERVHGLTALILGLFLLGVGANTGISKGTVDILAGLLAIPEYPAVRLRLTMQDWLNWMREKSGVHAELNLLREENARLRILESALKNERILAELASRIDAARVNLRAPMTWWSEIRIDKGERDSVAIGTPVLNDGYLIGRVSSVSALSSWVELITSPSLMIPVVIEETRELGVAAGSGSGAVLLNYIPKGRGLRTGMTVSTALVGEQLPPGLPIGKIAEELEATPDGYAAYRIELGADLSRFYSVSLFGPAPRTVRQGAE